jgi:hypothetical protein
LQIRSEIIVLIANELDRVLIRDARRITSTGCRPRNRLPDSPRVQWQIHPGLVVVQRWNDFVLITREGAYEVAVLPTVVVEGSSVQSQMLAAKSNAPRL